MRLDHGLDLLVGSPPGRVSGFAYKEAVFEICPRLVDLSDHGGNAFVEAAPPRRHRPLAKEREYTVSVIVMRDLADFHEDVGSDTLYGSQRILHGNH